MCGPPSDSSKQAESLVTLSATHGAPSVAATFDGWGGGNERKQHFQLAMDEALRQSRGLSCMAFTLR